MVVSLKANKKRILAFVILVAVVIGACIFLWSGKEEAQPQTFAGGTNEERTAFLQSFGWEIDPEPAQTREVMIPAEFNDVYTTYNVMQKAQGFDLKPYAGEVCTQYMYKINNYSGETEVYATLLVYGELIIGGDVACAEADGFMHGFAKDSARYGETAESGSQTREQSSLPASSAPQMESSNPQPESSAPQSESSAAASGTEAAAEEQPESAAAESTAGEALSEEAFPTD